MIKQFICRWFHKADHESQPTQCHGYQDGASMWKSQWWCKRCGCSWQITTKFSPDFFDPPVFTVGEYVSNGVYRSLQNGSAEVNDK